MPPRKRPGNLPVRRSSRYQHSKGSGESFSNTVLPDSLHQEPLYNTIDCETAKLGLDEGCNVTGLDGPKNDKKDSMSNPGEENESETLMHKKVKRAERPLPSQEEEQAPEPKRRGDSKHLTVDDGVENETLTAMQRRRAVPNVVSYEEASSGASSPTLSVTKDQTSPSEPGTRGKRGRGRPRGRGRGRGRGASTIRTPAARTVLKDGLLSDPNGVFGQITLELLFDQTIFRRDFTAEERVELFALLPDCDMVFPDTEQLTDCSQKNTVNITPIGHECESGRASKEHKVAEESAFVSGLNQQVDNNERINLHILKDDTKSISLTRSDESRKVIPEDNETTFAHFGSSLPASNDARTRTPIDLVSNIFENHSFREAILSWQLDLINGRRTPQYLQQQESKRLKAARREEKRKRICLINAGELAANDVEEEETSSDSDSEVDDGVWKDEMFEAWWGEKRELTAKNHHLAGDAAAVNLKTMCEYNLIQEHDQLIYKRTIRGRVFIEELMTIVSTKNRALTVRLGDGTLLSDITNPGSLETKILERRGPIGKKIPNGNAFKNMTIIRGGEDLGRLFDLRRDFFVNCHA